MHRIEKLLIENTQYQGNSEANRKALSGSEIGNDLLQIDLRQKHGVINKYEFNQATIGSLVHIGIQELLKKEYISEYDVEVKNIYKGFDLTGSIDLLDIKNRELFDIKVTKQYTMTKVLTEPNHQYIWQLSLYRYALHKMFGFDFKPYIIFVLKDGGFDFKSMLTKPSIVIEPIPYKSYEEGENKVFNIIDNLMSKEPVPQCKDLWFRKTKNGAFPMRCKLYCSYNEVCPYYKENPMNINF